MSQIHTSSTKVQTRQAERVVLKRLWWAGPLTVVVATLANALVRILAVSLLGISPAFQDLQWGPPLSLTIIGVTGAVLTFAVIGRFSSRPVRLFSRVALIVLIVSFLADFAMFSQPNTPGLSVTAVAVLMVMHIVAAVISVSMLTTLARTPESR